YTVCRNGCICYTGKYLQNKECPYCHCSRVDESGKPYRVFGYIPMIHRLRLLLSNEGYVNKI
ncbi:hypothetical protein EDC01DRAFT_595353, partial [Geopyxis carbonaria]